MKNKLVLFGLLLCSFFVANGQDNPIKKDIYGYVKTDFIFDSRQTNSVREGHFLAFPMPIQLDANGKDINSVPNFNILAIQSRFGIKVSGATLLNAKVSSILEADFFGQLNDNINLLRIRNAIVKMNWKTTELLFGQYWIPMFLTDCSPNTVNFNTGSPYQPFQRAPQFRLTQNFGKIKFVAIANSQRDNVSKGPAGSTSNYLRNSLIPELSAQLFFDSKNEDKKIAFLFGFGGSYKSILPELVTAKNYITTEKVSGYSAFVAAKIDVPFITIKIQGVYGQNISDQLCIGGYGVIANDTVTGIVKYSTINSLSAWAEISKTFKNWELGIFAGYAKNLGSEDIIIGKTYGNGIDIESSYRIAPRFSYQVDKLKFSLEFDYSTAKYGSYLNQYAVPSNLTFADNIRVLFATYYMF